MINMDDNLIDQSITSIVFYKYNVSIKLNYHPYRQTHLVYTKVVTIYGKYCIV